jgi:hypothetical protein
MDHAPRAGRNLAGNELGVRIALVFHSSFFILHSSSTAANREVTVQPHDRDDLDDYAPLIQRPKTATPKVIGILNIVFGSLLMLCGICFGLSLAMQFTMAPMFAMQQQEFQQLQQADRAQKLKDLENREQAAQDEKEKAAIQAQQQALKAQPLLKLPDMAKFTEAAGLQTYTIVDVVTGLILNILMVVSGIGLVSYKAWGRRLGLWVAACKIVRLVIVYGFFILVVVPNLSKALTEMFQEMFAQMAQAAPPGGPRIPGQAELAQMGTVFGTMYSGMAIGMIVLGVVYPVLVLIFLSRPHVKAACSEPTQAA